MYKSSFGVILQCEGVSVVTLHNDIQSDAYFLYDKLHWLIYNICMIILKDQLVYFSSPFSIIS